MLNAYLESWMSDINNSNTPKWLILENTSCWLTSLPGLLCAELPLVNPISYYTSNPIVAQSIRIWNQFRKSFALRSLSLSALIVKNHMFTPSILDGPFGIWLKGGISSLQVLYVDNNFSFKWQMN